VIRFIRPTLPPPSEWLPFLDESYRACWYSNCGPTAIEFERELTAKFGSTEREAILTCNATAGLTAAILAMNVQGSVVLPAFTFPATAMAILAANCRPVFCDVHPDTWELDPAELETLLESHDINAILHVRAFGFCRDISAIELTARRYGIPLIVDAAAALGGLLPSGMPAGQQGDVEVFSMHATKVFGIGEGGAIFAHPSLTASIRQVLNFGLAAGDVVRTGFNGKMSEFAAAVGRSVLRRIDSTIRARALIAERYCDAFADLPMVHVAETVGACAWQTFPMMLSGDVDAADIVQRAAVDGVELRRYYFPALHETTRFAPDSAFHPLPVSTRLARQMICLPVYTDMNLDEQTQVIRVVRDAIRSVARKPRPVALRVHDT
jgi:dTDP-4-amino-4,6-dideoxygalactose transaminase